MFYPEPVGDVVKGMEEAERKIISAEVSQLLFPIFHGQSCVLESHLCV